jgi:hypothetical protein
MTDELRRTRCHKEPHETRHKARIALIAAKRSGLGSGQTNIYRCPSCGFWHWGRLPGKNHRTTIRGWR